MDSGLLALSIGLPPAAATSLSSFSSQAFGTWHLISMTGLEFEEASRLLLPNTQKGLQRCVEKVEGVEEEKRIL